MSKDQYQPISPLGYVGYQLLFSIPVVGWIILVCMAIGASNINVRNFARSYFVILVISLVLCVLLMVLGVGTALFESINEAMRMT
jgi:hypothetical protein